MGLRKCNSIGSILVCMKLKVHLLRRFDYLVGESPLPDQNSGCQHCFAVTLFSGNILRDYVCQIVFVYYLNQFPILHRECVLENEYKNNGFKGRQWAKDEEYLNN